VPASATPGKKHPVPGTLFMPAGRTPKPRRGGEERRGAASGNHTFGQHAHYVAWCERVPAARAAEVGLRGEDSSPVVTRIRNSSRGTKYCGPKILRLILRVGHATCGCRCPYRAAPSVAVVQIRNSTRVTCREAQLVPPLQVVFSPASPARTSLLSLPAPSPHRRRQRRHRLPRGPATCC